MWGKRGGLQERAFKWMKMFIQAFSRKILLKSIINKFSKIFLTPFLHYLCSFIHEHLLLVLSQLFIWFCFSLKRKQKQESLLKWNALRPLKLKVSLDSNSLWCFTCTETTKRYRRRDSLKINCTHWFSHHLDCMHYLQCI